MLLPIHSAETRSKKVEILFSKNLDQVCSFLEEAVCKLTWTLEKILLIAWISGG